MTVVKKKKKIVRKVAPKTTARKKRTAEDFFNGLPEDLLGNTGGGLLTIKKSPSPFVSLPDGTLINVQSIASVEPEIQSDTNIATGKYVIYFSTGRKVICVATEYELIRRKVI